ncbi:hypothetical protein CYMTET_3687 [Cymbomonas tetramitiformis]|uniref:Uncharacterized protein n=1 Tax=Cymbomonas tetramitiformis TaxID=36881 RepID=A0AAE0H2S0_9CHLO|nr:hypothetical protein CYMTET_3687 [Cymbomonas tetramitiformis]|eukprot:gene996-1517_t
MHNKNNGRLDQVFSKVLTKRKPSSPNGSTQAMLALEAADDGNPYLNDETDLQLRARLVRMRAAVEVVHPRKNRKGDKATETVAYHATVTETLSRFRSRVNDVERILAERSEGRVSEEEIRELRKRNLSAEDLKLVDSFQVCKKYGPRSGMRPSERYFRAVKFALNPPDGILEILKKWPERLDREVCL